MGMHAVMNHALRRLDNMFPGYFQTTTKRDHYVDFGYPKELEFGHFYSMYMRNGIAAAGIDKTILKTWQDNPLIQEDDDTDDLTPSEQKIFDHFKRIRLWQKVAEADRQSLVGSYAALIFRFADNKKMDQPVDGVPGGLDGLVDVIPAWEGQLTVADWDQNELSETYGQPVMYQFKEQSVGNSKQQRQFNVHPDRVLIWSRDGTIFGRSLLSAGYNNLIDIEKVHGAGGEGFWKNAKSSPVLAIDKDARIDDMAKVSGVEPDKLTDAMNEQVDSFNKGFDASLLLAGMKATTLSVTLPQPEQFYMGPLNAFAASVGIPVKILIGMQTGERASTEDAQEWSQTCMSRRNNSVLPNIEAMIERFVSFRIMKDQKWSIYWPDLTESSMSEKIERAEKMAIINQKHYQSGGRDYVFTDDEMRETTGYKPLTDAEKLVDEFADTKTPDEG